MATFREKYKALMVINDRKQAEVGRALGHQGNGMVRAVVFTDDPRDQRKLDLDDLEKWIRAAGPSTSEQRETLRDLAYADYGTDRDRRLRSALKATALALRGIRETLIKKHVEPPQDLAHALQEIESLVGD